MAAVWLLPNQSRALRRAGVRDSKEFGQGATARQERARLSALIRERACAALFEVAPPSEVDRYVSQGLLDLLEREMALRLIKQGPAAKRIIADGRLFAPLSRQVPGLRSLPRADARFTAVAAASIVAKHQRDELFLQQAQQHGELAPLCERGMGYANAGTRAFLRAYVHQHGRLPPETRRSWRWSALDEVQRQLTLF